MKRERGNIVEILIFCVTLFCAIALSVLGDTCRVKTVNAVSDNPMYVSAEQFEVVGSDSNFSSYYLITLQYNGKEPLPQFLTAKYAVDGISLATDDTDVLEIKILQPVNAKENQINLYFAWEAFNKAAPTKLIIDEGTEFLVSDKYRENGGKYTALKFTDALTIEKSEKPDVPSGWLCYAQPTYKRYEVDVAKEGVFLGVARNDDGTVHAEIKVPFAASGDASYAVEKAPFAWNGTAYAETPQITQAKDSDVITFTFPKSKDVIGSMGNITLTFSAGEVLDKTLGLKVVFEGTRTFKSYADGVFSESDLIEIRVRDGDLYSVETKPNNAGNYVIPSPKASNGIFYAWYIGDEKIDIGATVNLQEHKTAGLDIVAEYLDCGLRSGVWLLVGSGTDTSGMRFQADIRQETYEKYKEDICGIGIIVMPRDLLKNGKSFELKNYSGDNGALDFFVPKTSFRFQEGTFSLKATLVDLFVGSNGFDCNFNRTMMARAYVKMRSESGDVYYWENTVVQRSVRDLAAAVYSDVVAEKDEERLVVLERYLNDVLVIDTSGETPTVEDVTGKLGVTIESNTIEGTPDKQKVRLVLVTAREKFAGVTYNGVRIDGGEQTFEDGKLTVLFDLPAA